MVTESVNLKSLPHVGDRLFAENTCKKLWKVKLAIVSLYS